MCFSISFLCILFAASFFLIIQVLKNQLNENECYNVSRPTNLNASIEWNVITISFEGIFQMVYK